MTPPPLTRELLDEMEADAILASNACRKHLGIECGHCMAADRIFRMYKVKPLIAMARRAEELEQAFETQKRLCFNAHEKVVSAKAENKRLREALADLEMAEARYRTAHDIHGQDHRTTGYCWDQLRHAGDRARAALAEVGGS